MRSLIVTSLVSVALLATTPTFAAKDPNINAIKARQGEMQLRSFNAGPLFGMARGKVPYDAETASKLANNLKTLLSVDMGRSWPQGSDMDNYFGETSSQCQTRINGSQTSCSSMAEGCYSALNSS